MSFADRIREMIANVEDATAPVTLPKVWVEELLNAHTPRRSELGPEPLGGYTIAQVAAAFHRDHTTIWAWVQAGEFSGAYRLQGREWRLPLKGIEAFLARQQAPREKGRRQISLGSWRKQYGKSNARRKRL